MKAKTLVVIIFLSMLLFVGSACGIGLTEAEQHYNDGVDLYEEGRLWEAIVEFDKAIELDPDMAEAYYNRGLTYHDLGEYERAIEDLDEAIRLDPQNAMAYAFRAVAYTLLNMDAEAQKDLDQAVALGFDPVFLEEMIEAAKEIR